MPIAEPIIDSHFKKQLLSGIIWRGCNVLLAFAYNVMLVTQLGAGQSGNFYYLLNNLFFIVLLLGIGLESGISFFNSRKEISTSHLFSISVVWSAMGAGIFLIFFTFFSAQLHLGYNQFFLVAYIFGAMLTTFLSSIYFTQHNNKVPNLVACSTTVILILLLPKMPWVNGAISFNTYIAVYLSSSFFSALVLTITMLRKKILFSFSSLQPDILKPILLFSFHSFIISLLFNLLKRSDFWLVNKWCPVADAGNYFQACKVMQLLLLLPALASFSLYPLIVKTIKKNEGERGSSDTESKVLQLVGLYFFIAITLSLGILLFGYWVFPVLYGPTFNHLYQVTLYLIPGLVFFAATYPLTTYFAGKNQNMRTILYLGISIAVLFLSNVILTPRYFIYGAAISSSVSNIVYFILLVSRFFIMNKLPFNCRYFRFSLKLKAISKSFYSLR